MQSLISVILLLSVFLVPLIPATGGFGFEQAKILTFLGLVSIAGGIWAVWWSKHPTQAAVKWSKPKLAGAIFLLILFVASLLGVEPLKSIIGVVPYFQGWIIYAYLFLLYLLVSHLKVPLLHWAIVYTGSATVVAVIAIREWLTVNLWNQPLLTYGGRVGSTFGQPNFYSGFILMALPFYLFLFQQKKGRFIVALSFWIALFGAIISVSRVTFLLLSAFLIWWLIWQLPKYRAFTLGMVLGCFMLITIFANANSTGLIAEELNQPLAINNPDLTQQSIEKRAYLWPVLVQLSSQKLWQGYGLENINTAFSNFFLANKHALFEENLKVSPVLISLKDLVVDRSHNYALDLMLFAGVFGLGSWVVLVWLLLQKARGNHILLASLLLYLVWVQFQNQSIVHLMHFWLLAGLIDRYGRIKSMFRSQKGIIPIPVIVILAITLIGGTVYLKNTNKLSFPSATSMPAPSPSNTESPQPTSTVAETPNPSQNTSPSSKPSSSAQPFSESSQPKTRTVTVTGFAYEDRTDDGLFNSDDPKLPNMYFTYYDSTYPDKYLNMHSNQDGSFYMSLSVEGSLVIKPQTYNNFRPKNDSLRYDKSTSGVQIGFRSASAPVVSQVGIIEGDIFNDTNRNKVMDSGEAPVYFYKLYLVDSNGNYYNTVEGAQATETSGHFKYMNLPVPGSYTIRLSNPTGDYTIETPETSISLTSAKTEAKNLQISVVKN